MTWDLTGLAGELSARGEPYAVATVVWRRAPSSGQLGSRALITADGRIRGWVAGACAEPTVIAQAQEALRSGAPRLVFLGTPEEVEEHRRDGLVSVPISCQSEGALEVYVEPVLPRPHLAVIGRSPAADVLVRMAAALGWRSVLIEDGGQAADHPGVPAFLDALDLDAAGVGPGSFVVVATQGHYDEDALEAVLAREVAYVGLVASARRADGVRDYLLGRGVDPARVAAVRAPAGLDLGSVSSEEIAVAVLAELVALRASGRLPAGAPGAPSSAVHEAVDPVCGMTVRVATARHRATHEGRTFYFCGAGCLRAFEADPAAFLGSGSPVHRDS